MKLSPEVLKHDRFFHKGFAKKRACLQNCRSLETHPEPGKRIPFERLRLAEHFYAESYAVRDRNLPRPDVAAFTRPARRKRRRRGSLRRRGRILWRSDRRAPPRGLALYRRLRPPRRLHAAQRAE